MSESIPTLEGTSEAPDDLALDRYLAGECEPVESRQVERWLARHADDAVVVATVLAHVAGLGDGQGTTNSGDVAAQLLARYKAAPAARSHNTDSHGPNHRLLRGMFVRGHTARWWGWSVGTIAAVIVAIAMGRSGGVQQIAQTQTYHTRAGQQASVTLADGTRMTIAPLSTVQVELARSGRRVAVDGEVYFEVASASSVPFFVRNGDAVTEVLGTNFLVRHYATDRMARIAVASGKVRVSSQRHAGAQATLAGGHVATLVDSTITVVPVDDQTAEAGWMAGKLSFDETPLPDVLATLRRWYGYEFRLADPALQHERVTAVLSTHSSAAALSNLELILGVNLSVVGDTITLTPRTSAGAAQRTRARTYDTWTPNREVGR